MKHKILIIGFSFILCLMTSLWAKDKLPSSELLKGWAKSIQIPGSSFKTFSADITMNLPLPLKLLCQIRYEANNNYSLRVFDMSDKTPFLIVSDKKGIIYNPTNGKVTLVSSGGAFFELVPNGKDFNANFAINLPVDGKAKDKFVLDFDSMFKRIVDNIEVVPGNSSQTFILKGDTQQKGWAKAYFDIKNIYKLTRIEAAPEGSTKPFLIIDKIKANEKLEKHAFSFPEAMLKKSGLEIDKISGEGFMDTVSLFSAIMKMMFTRVAINNKEVRESIEKMLHIKPDWDKMSIVDAKSSRILRGIFQPL